MIVSILDDEPEVAEPMARHLEGNGHTVHRFTRADQLFRHMTTTTPDILILDWMMPTMTGIQVLEHIRKNDAPKLPVIMVTAMDSETSVVAGLNAGADDYLIKPVKLSVFKARVDALMRRLGHQEKASSRITVGKVELELDLQAVTVDGSAVTLTTKEFELLWLLAKRQGQLVTKAEALAAIWGNRPDLLSHTLSQHVYALRSKLKTPASGVNVRGVYGVGYRLEVLSEADPSDSAER
jgi:DNA-binding response OmpR family regulator